MSILKQALLFLASAFFSISAAAQGNSNLSSDPYHHWDGVTHWTKYQIVSAGHFGPNALPVPEIRKGRIDSTIDLEIKAVNAYNKRDNTPSIAGRLYFPVVKDKIAIELYGTIAEYFDMDSTLRFERRTFMMEGKGTTFGDLNVGTVVNIIKDQPKMPDIALAMTFKTTSGKMLKSARYTDAPGYFFDVSFGKKIVKKNYSIRLYALTGFYVWQTNIDNNPQDDAFLYGVGADLNLRKFLFSTSWGGYLGYVNNGDQPMVYRASVVKKGGGIDAKFSYQYGLHDYNYQTFSLSAIWHLKTLK